MDIYLNFLSYVVVAVGMMFVGTILFALSTPTINEFKLITNRNVTAAMSLGGKIIGLGFVLGSAIEHSISLTDMMIWGGIGILSQIVVFYLAEALTVRYSLRKAIEEDNVAVGTMLLSLSIAVGWVISKCLTY